MTVPTTTNKVIGFGDGLATVFPFTFGTLPSGDLVVTLFDTIGTSIPQSEVTNYTVLGKGAEDGGSVVFVVPPPAGYTVLIQRILATTQPDDLKNQGSYYPRTVERMFDRRAMVDQQLEETIGRTLTLPPQVQGVSAELPSPVPLNLIGWDQTALALRNFTPGDIGTTLAFSNFIADRFTATPGQVLFTLSADPGAIGNLDVSIDGVTQRPFDDYDYLGTALTFVTPMAGGEKILARYGTALPTGITAASAVTWSQPAGLVQSVQDELRRVIRPEHFPGCDPTGATLSDTAFLTAIALGKEITLTPGAVYYLSVGKAFVNGTKLVCKGGIATIKLKTGTGGFTNVSQGGTRTATDRCVFPMVGTDDNAIEGVEFITDGVKECCLYPIRTAGGFASKGLRIERVRFRGFALGVLIGLNTVGEGSYQIRDIYAKDITTAQGSAYWTGGGTNQATVVEVDNDMVAAVPSVHGVIENIEGINVLYTGQAAIDFGQQTDLVNIAGVSGTDQKGPTIRGLYADRVGEVLDLFCNGAVVTGIRCKNVHLFPIKLIHGAQGNSITDVQIGSYGLAAVTFAGSSSLVGHTKDNYVKISVVRGCGDDGAGPSGTEVPVVLVQENGGSLATCLPRNNVCDVDLVVAGANLDYMVKDNCVVANSNGNLVRFTKIVGSPTVSFGLIASTGNTRARYLNAQPAHATVGVNQTLNTAAAATIQYQTVASDADGIFNTGTYTAQPKYPGWYNVRAQVRIAGGNATDYTTLRILKNGVAQAQQVRVYGTGAVEVTPTVEMAVLITENEAGTAAANLRIEATHTGAATVTALNTATMSFVQFIPLGGIV
jgi:hypothetical protein